MLVKSEGNFLVGENILLSRILHFLNNVIIIKTNVTPSGIDDLSRFWPFRLNPLV